MTDQLIDKNKQLEVIDTAIKTCANCQSPLAGPYCGQCGQEVNSTLKYFWTVMLHLLDDIFSFDSRAKRTLIPLLTNEDFPTKAVYTQYRNILLNPNDNQFTFDNNANEDHIYVINIQRSRLKEKLDPGNWELVLSGSTNAGSTAVGHNITKLIDNSGGADATIADGKRVYNIVSGSIANGELTTDDDGTKGGYGLVYPDLGILVLNPGRLKLRGIIPTGNVATELSSSNFNNQYNSALFKAISGSAAYDSTYGFQARNEEEVTSTYYYIRVKNADYNFSNNPTFVTGSLGALKHASMIKDPKSYVTTVGLYNDKQELLATAKLSKPLLKSFDREALIKVKLDF